MSEFKVEGSAAAAIDESRNRATASLNAAADAASSSSSATDDASSSSSSSSEEAAPPPPLVTAQDLMGAVGGLHQALAAEAQRIEAKTGRKVEVPEPPMFLVSVWAQTSAPFISRYAGPVTENPYVQGSVCLIGALMIVGYMASPVIEARRKGTVTVEKKPAPPAKKPVPSPAPKTKPAASESAFSDEDEIKDADVLSVTTTEVDDEG